MCKPKAKKKILYLYDKQIKHINKIAKKNSISPSSALRIIINKDMQND